MYVGMGIRSVGALDAQTVGIIGHVPRGRSVGHGCQLPTMLPSVSPRAVREHITDLVGGDSLSVLTGQKVALFPEGSPSGNLFRRYKS